MSFDIFDLMEPDPDFWDPRCEDREKTDRDFEDNQ
jgi:hypothetical protein